MVTIRPACVICIRYQYNRDKVTKPGTHFDLIEKDLLDLVEEVAALVELVRDNDRVQELLDEAGHAINAAVRPGGVITQPNPSPEIVRKFRLEQADVAFQAAAEAVKALGFNI